MTAKEKPFPVNVVAEETTDYCDRDYSQEYGEWSASYSKKYIRLEKSDSEYGGFYLDKEPEQGQYFFLVYAVYSSGDSFGSSSGNHEEIEIFDTLEKAKELIEILNKDDRKFSHEPKGNYIKFDGKSIYTGTWKGYFETLERFGIKPLQYFK